ncbi:unnamed protein product, partial [Choristocarpus tenellus]
MVALSQGSLRRVAQLCRRICIAQPIALRRDLAPLVERLAHKRAVQEIWQGGNGQSDRSSGVGRGVVAGAGGGYRDGVTPSHGFVFPALISRFWEACVLRRERREGLENVLWDVLRLATCEMWTASTGASLDAQALTSRASNEAGGSDGSRCNLDDPMVICKEVSAEDDNGEGVGGEEVSKEIVTEPETGAGDRTEVDLEPLHAGLKELMPLLTSPVVRVAQASASQLATLLLGVWPDPCPAACSRKVAVGKTESSTLVTVSKDCGTGAGKVSGSSVKEGQVGSGSGSVSTGLSESAIGLMLSAGRNLGRGKDVEGNEDGTAGTSGGKEGSAGAEASVSQGIDTGGSGRGGEQQSIPHTVSGKGIRVGEGVGGGESMDEDNHSEASAFYMALRASLTDGGGEGEGGGEGDKVPMNFGSRELAGLDQGSSSAPQTKANEKSVVSGTIAEAVTSEAVTSSGIGATALPQPQPTIPAPSKVCYRCDGCDLFPLQRVRFHCLVCPDFDLCPHCYALFHGPESHFRSTDGVLGTHSVLHDMEAHQLLPVPQTEVGNPGQSQLDVEISRDGNRGTNGDDANEPSTGLKDMMDVVDGEAEGGGGEEGNRVAEDDEALDDEDDLEEEEED